MKSPRKSKTAVGIDVGGTFIKAGLVANDGKIITELDQIPTNAERGHEYVIKQIADAVYRLKNGNDIGVGIGMPGLVSLDRRTVKYPPNFPGWEVVDLAQRVSEVAEAKQVVVDNDANCAGLGEARFGAGKNIQSFILATLGTGVGGAIIMDGDVFHGEEGGAGEIGHTTIDYRGPQCNCGSFGCVEAYIGNNYFTERVWNNLQHRQESLLHTMAKSRNDLTPMVITEAAENGDTFAREELREAGYCLGVGLANVMGLFDIHTVLLGGGMAKAGELIFESTRRAIKQFSQPPIANAFRVLPAELGNNAGILGAAALVL